jgi:hypothetical protein
MYSLWNSYKIFVTESFSKFTLQKTEKFITKGVIFMQKAKDIFYEYLRVISQNLQMFYSIRICEHK